MSHPLESSSKAVYNHEITEEENAPTSQPQVAIDVERGDVPNIRKTVVQILLDRVKDIKSKNTFSPIYMAPSRFRELSPSSFTPRVVSIGPMHKDNTNFKSMEARKPNYLKELFSEGGFLDEETLQKCVKMVSDDIEKIKSWYYGRNKKYDDDELIQMMIMDGCFILHFISKLSKSVNTLSENRLRSRSIALDLVLLENQIPFFVLEYIYQCTLKNLQSKDSLTTMLCILLEHVNPFLEKLDEDNLAETNHYHILDLLHKFYQPTDTTLPKISVVPTAHSVVNLDKVGVKFRPKDKKNWPKEKKNCPKEKKNWPMAMEFESSGKPTLIMPAVYIDNFFEVVIRNLIVWEQYSPVNNHVTSYAMAMDMLADSPEDIAKLGQSNIIINHLGSNEKASNMINNICKDVTFVDFYYIEPWKNMDSYYDSYWSRHFGILRRTHFDSPWKTIALIAGIILFTLNLVQFTFFLKDK